LTLREEHRLRVFEESDEVAGEWRKCNNEELLDLDSSPSIIRIIKSRRMGWVEHVARVEKRNVYSCWWENQREIGD
jgi:hypothetical protein